MVNYAKTSEESNALSIPYSGTLRVIALIAAYAVGFAAVALHERIERQPPASTAQKATGEHIIEAEALPPQVKSQEAVATTASSVAAPSSSMFERRDVASRVSPIPDDLFPGGRAASSSLFEDSFSDAPEVRVYVAPDPRPLEPLFRKFKEKTGIRVRARGGSVRAILSRALAEKDNPDADVMILPDLSSLMKAADGGLFAPLPQQDIIARVPSGYKNKTGTWRAISRRFLLPFYARDREDIAAPKDYADLASPRFKGQVTLPFSPGYAAMIASMKHELGTQAVSTWMHAVSDNLRGNPSEGDAAGLRAVAAGKAAVTLASSAAYAGLFHSGFSKDQVTAETVVPAVPEQGAYADIHGAGILAKCTRATEARQLLAFMSGPVGARLVAEAFFEHPVSSKIHPVLHSLALVGDDPGRLDGPSEAAAYVAGAEQEAAAAGWGPVPEIQENAGVGSR